MRLIKAYAYALMGILLLICAVPLLHREEAAKPVGAEYIFADTPVLCSIYYTACRHSNTQELRGSAEFNNRSFAELSEEGWYAYWGEEGSACLYTEREGLCPSDARKYHLISEGSRLIIVHGPKGYDGEVEGSIQIEISRLPEKWRNGLETGGIEFPDREALLVALESLDEI